MDEGTIHAIARGEEAGLELEGDLAVIEAGATQIKANWPSEPSFGSVWSNVTSCEFTFAVDGHAVSYTWHAGD